MPITVNDSNKTTIKTITITAILQGEETIIKIERDLRSLLDELRHGNIGGVGHDSELHELLSNIQKKLIL